MLGKLVGINQIILRNINMLKTLTKDKGLMTNDSHRQLALITPTYLKLLFKIQNLKSFDLEEF